MPIVLVDFSVCFSSALSDAAARNCVALLEDIDVFVVLIWTFVGMHWLCERIVL